MDTISFKLDPAVARELDRRAGGQPGGSRHTAARQIVLEVLTDVEPARTPNEVAELKEQIEGLRHDLATSVVALLVRGGQVESAAEAEAWVRNALLK
jgi:hypothetical protein